MYLSTKKLTTVLAAALLVPAGLAAQDHEAHHPEEDPPQAQDAPAKAEMMTMPCPMMGERMMMRERHGMMMQERPGMMSDMRAMQRGMAAMQPGPRMLLHHREALGLSEAQVEELERLQARVDDFLAETRRDAMDVLTDEQRSNVRFGMRMMEHMMERMRGGEGSMSPGSEEGHRGSDGGHHRMKPQ